MFSDKSRSFEYMLQNNLSFEADVILAKLYEQYSDK